MPGKAFLISILVSVLLCSTPMPSEILHLSGIRPPFFLLKIKAPGSKFEKGNVIYRDNGLPAGNYELLDSSGGVFLCRCRDLSLDIDSGCYVKVENPTVPPKKSPVKMNSRESEVIRLRGIRFRRMARGVYVTLNPVPLSIIPEMSMGGVDRFANRIMDACSGDFRISLLSPEETVKFLQGARKRAFLALRDGSPVLVFVDPPDIRENRVSDKIMMRLKYNLFIPLKAEAQ